MTMKKLIKISPKALLLVLLFLASGCTNTLHGNYQKQTNYSDLYWLITHPIKLTDEGCIFKNITITEQGRIDDKVDFTTGFKRIYDSMNEFLLNTYPSLDCSYILGNGDPLIGWRYGLTKEIHNISELMASPLISDINKRELKGKLDKLVDKYFPVVSVSSLPKQDEKGDTKSLINLSDHGQEALIHELANLSKIGGKSGEDDAAKNLIKVLSTEFKPEQKKGPLNLTVFDRWLYVTVKEPKILAPADRVVKTIVSISLQNLKKDKASEDSPKDENTVYYKNGHKSPDLTKIQNKSKDIPENIPARFVYWDKAVTAYETIEQGEIKTELSNKAELTAKVAPPATAPVEGSLEGTLSRQLTRSETLPVKQGSEQLTVNIECLKLPLDNTTNDNINSENKSGISPKLVNKNCYGDDGNGVLNTLSIYKRSVTGGQPLTGTTQVGVKIKLGNFDNSPDPKTRNIKAVSIDGLDKTNCKNSSITCLTERQEKLSFQDVTLVNPNFIKGPLRANLDTNFVIRHVTSGWDTYEEGDDDIELIQYNDQRNNDQENKANPIILLPSEIPKYYGIFTNSKSLMPMPLVAKYDNAPDEDVRFICYESMADANKFIDFFRNIPPPPSSYRHSSPYTLVPGLSVTTFDHFNNLAINQPIYSADGLVVKWGCGEQFAPNRQSSSGDIPQSILKKATRQNKTRRS